VSNPSGATADSETEASASDGRAADPQRVDSGAAVEAHLDDALERVAHGATVSVPGILIQRGLTVAFTAVLTNGFTAAAYGLFVLARRLQRFPMALVRGYHRGLSRFLPTADGPIERDSYVTVALAVTMTAAVVLGAGLYLATPRIAALAGQGQRFELYLRIFAVGMPASVGLFSIGETMRGLEAVGPLTLTLRLGFPGAQLLVGLVGVVLVGNLAFVAGGVVAAMGLVGLTAAGWLVKARGLRLRPRATGIGAVAVQYLRYTTPLFLNGIATTIQRLGFYPLIALYLTEVAGGVFAVGILLGGLVRLPLNAINQFIPPVAAALNQDGHDEALARLYHVTSRIVLVGVTALSVPMIVYREAVMGLFGETFVQYAPLLPGFILAQYGACAAGSVGILLMMTDHQKAMFAVNSAVTAVLVVIAIPLTVSYGLSGLVASYFLMLTLNNGLEVVVLYHLEGLQPFTRLHLKPLGAAVPLLGVALAADAVLGSLAPLVGTIAGLVCYSVVLRSLGFTAVEGRLARTLAQRYRELLARSRQSV